VTVLLDTHAFLWFVLNDPRLSAAAKAAIEDPANAVLVSPASYWETAIKISVGKYRLNRPYDEFWQRGTQGANMTPLPIEVRHTSKLASAAVPSQGPLRPVAGGPSPRRTNPADQRRRRARRVWRHTHLVTPPTEKPTATPCGCRVTARPA
jgi:PIN domain nuclease of toxin-antitoxin system